MNERSSVLSALCSAPQISVLIAGGGVNGIGLFRELCLQGVDCLLAERRDFVSGASSKSSRLIHGGLRYLENGEVRLVRTALIERDRLLGNAPHYVRPLQVVIPFYSYLGGILKCPLLFAGLPLQPGGRGALVTKAGLLFYDMVSRKYHRLPRHSFFTRKAALSDFPELSGDILGAASYWDARITEAERLCIELLEEALGACPDSFALNYLEVLDRRGEQVLLRDAVSGEVLAVRPRVVINAAGAWIDRVNERLGLNAKLIGGTKGSHLVIRNDKLHRALRGRMLYYEYADGRLCLAFPLEDTVLVGTTDIPVDDPDRARCERSEVEYLLSALKSVLPGLEVSERQIVHSFCGVRPLPAERANVPGRISRDHRIVRFGPAGDRPFPVFSLVGGKWTTFRALSEEACDRVLDLLGMKRRVWTKKRPIGGGRNWPADPERWSENVARTSGLSKERVASLLGRYGTRAAELAREFTSSGDRPLDTLPDFSYREIERIVRREFVVSLSDIVYRRTLIGISGRALPEALQELARVAGRILGWNEEKCREQIHRVRAEVGT